MPNRTSYRCRTAICICACALFIVSHLNDSWAFIRREYTLPEVLNACTNVVFGTVQSVDPKRLRVVVSVDENVKGMSEYKRIQIDAIMGQGKFGFPRSFIDMLRPELPVVILYSKQGRKIISLGYVAGKWFQMFATDEPDKDNVWWRYTQIQIYMYRTFCGDTDALKQAIRDTLAGKIISPIEINVLVLADNDCDVEFPVLSKFNSMGRHINIKYQRAENHNLPDLEEYQILWLGQNGIKKGKKYFLNKKVERKITDFVAHGGVVIVSGQDSEKKPCPTGWIPEPILGVSRERRNDFRATESARDLFFVPNTVKTGQICLDDTWIIRSTRYTVLATTNNEEDIAIAELRYSRGLYLIAGICNETSKDVQINAAIMENLIHYAVRWIIRNRES